MLQNIRLQLGNELKLVNVKLSTMFIIEDNKGGNAICGRHIHYRKTARRISCTYNAGLQPLSNPTAGSYNRFMMKDFMKFVQDQNGKALYDLYQAQLV